MVGEENPVNFLTLAIYAGCMFVGLVLSHIIPTLIHFNKTAKKWFLIVFFGLLVGTAFNMILPGSLHVVTEAWEAYENATETEEMLNYLLIGRRLHGGGDDDDDDDGFRRIIGVAICTGFMIMFLSDFISKEFTKKQRKEEIELPLFEEEEKEKDAYTVKATVNLYATYYVFCALGCMGGYLASDCPVQRSMILVSQGICIIPIAILYGVKMVDDHMSTKQISLHVLLLSLIVPICDLSFILILNLFNGELAYFVISLGYPLFCGLVIYLTMMYFISMVHVEETVTSAVTAFLMMIIPYFVFMVLGQE